MLCERCGYEDTTGLLEKRVDRGASKTCPSCRARPATVVKTEFGECMPHQGDFDDYDNPLDANGELFRPGFRKCFKSDCVNPEHIFGAAEAERNDLSYRTGVKLSVKDLWDKIAGERVKRRRGSK